MYGHIHFWQRNTIDRQSKNRDVPGFPRYFNTLSGVGIKWFALVFQRRKHGGDLLALANKGLTSLTNLVFAYRYRTLFHNVTVGIRRRSTDTQFSGDFVLFVGIQQKLRKLGRLSQTDWQHAGCQWIKCPGMPRFLRLKQPTDLLQQLIR